MGIDNVYGLGSLRPGVCTSTTRPGSPFTGQLIYETDTKKVLAYSGTAWEEYRKAAAGQVLQVVQTVKTDTWSAANTNGGDFDVTGLSVTITPSSTSSKILVMASVSKGSYGGIILKRGSTVLTVGDAAGSRTRVFMSTAGAAAGMAGPATPVFLDSPSSTSALEYKVAMRDNHWSVATTMYVNRSEGDANQIYDYRTVSTITAMEISG